MRYQRLQEGVFLSRPNRFLAHIRIEGKEEVCHVKNTGRLQELLLPGTNVLVEPAPEENHNRKTRFSLIAVWHDAQWVNIDSQVPNQIAEEWIKDGNLVENITLIKREKKYQNSRFDLYVENERQRWFVEVKGVTRNVDGAGLFPDAPTVRGEKHIRELIACKKEGYQTAILFVIQRKGIRKFMPDKERHPEFFHTLQKAAEAGVLVLAVDCKVDRDGIKIDRPIPVDLSER